LKSIVDTLKKMWRMPRQERGLLIQAWLLLIAADCALRLFPFTTLMEYGRRRSARRKHCSMDKSLPVSRLARLVETAGRYCPAGTTCLKEALVLSWLLARRGLPATLRIGVGQQAGSFAAHAWLEQDGLIVLGDQGLDAYVPLLSSTTGPDRS